MMAARDVARRVEELRRQHLQVRGRTYEATLAVDVAPPADIVIEVWDPSVAVVAAPP